VDRGNYELDDSDQAEVYEILPSGLASLAYPPTQWNLRGGSRISVETGI
jgi:hypothetical protein